MTREGGPAIREQVIPTVVCGDDVFSFSVPGWIQAVASRDTYSASLSLWLELHLVASKSADIQRQVLFFTAFIAWRCLTTWNP